MSAGRVAGLYLGPETAQPMSSVDSLRAVAGSGIEGDRYFEEVPSAKHDPTHEITLIELEAIEGARSEYDIEFEPEDTRRNIVTHGIRLDDLLGTTFTVGEVQIEALEKNPPCARLVRITEKKLLKPLIHRGGVRGRIVSTGTIKVGDPITP